MPGLHKPRVPGALSPLVGNPRWFTVCPPPAGVDAYGWLQEHGFSGPVVFLTGHARSHPWVRRAQRFPAVRDASRTPMRTPRGGTPLEREREGRQG
jgi:hypothetical protein